MNKVVELIGPVRDKHRIGIDMHLKIEYKGL